MATFEAIASQEITSAISNLTFSSIPATYQHLQLRIQCRATNASNSTNLILRFNGVTTSIYGWGQIFGSGSSVGVNQQANVNAITVQYYPAGTAASNHWGSAVIDIAEYSSTTKFKTTRALMGGADGGATFAGVVSHSYGIFRDTPAISSIYIQNAGGTFVAGSVFSLYGLAGA